VLFNYLNQTEKKNISSCNFNHHIRSCHPDRIMNVHDLLYIKDGRWYISQDGEGFTVNAGDVIFLHSGHHHYGFRECESVVNTCYIHFAPHADDRAEEIFGDEQKKREGFYAFPTLVHCGDEPLIRKYFERVINAFWADEPYEKAKASVYLELLLCEISNIGSKKRSVADEIKDQIKKTPERFILNEEFAEKFGCSVRTISAKFKESTGSSLHAWQMEQKCRMADELLKNEPTLTLKEVAATYGFYDEYHFGKCFKKIMGHSPKRAK